MKKPRFESARRLEFLASQRVGQAHLAGWKKLLSVHWATLRPISTPAVSEPRKWRPPQMRASMTSFGRSSTELKCLEVVSVVAPTAAPGTSKPPALGLRTDPMISVTAPVTQPCALGCGWGL